MNTTTDQQTAMVKVGCILLFAPRWAIGTKEARERYFGQLYIQRLKSLSGNLEPRLGEMYVEVIRS